MNLMATLMILFICLGGMLPAQKPELPDDKTTLVPGEVETPEGCPVELTEASYTLKTNPSTPRHFQIVGNQVTVRNTSGRKIIQNTCRASTPRSLIPADTTKTNFIRNSSPLQKQKYVALIFTLCYKVLRRT